MTEQQTKLLVIALVVIGVVLAFVMLTLGDRYDAFDACGGGPACAGVSKPIFVGSEGVGLYSPYGVKGIILGFILPLCLFALAAFLAVGPKGWGTKEPE